MAEGKGNDELLCNGYIVSGLQDKKSSGDHLHNIVKIINTIEQYVKMGEMVNFMLCAFYHFYKLKVGKGYK